jgi:hypothetical protein
MKQEVLLELLEEASARLGVKVSYEALTVGSAGTVGHGGLCRIKTAAGWQHRIIIDKRATPQERVATLASSLSKVVDPANDAVELDAKVKDALYLHGDRRRAS